MAIKFLKFEQDKANEQERLQLIELDEIRRDTYESARIYKEKIKVFHNQVIMCKSFTPIQKVILYNSRLHLFPRKLRSRWSRLYILWIVYQHGAIDIENPKNSNIFKVNRQILKLFLESQLLITSRSWLITTRNILQRMQHTLFNRFSFKFII